MSIAPQIVPEKSNTIKGSHGRTVPLRALDSAAFFRCGGGDDDGWWKMIL
ncbi:MAG: hypothetical protein FWE80_00615 [Oscillospiraceae bacterium]|nr:hypothetical protein [Oscillospiraceae bacterium]